MTDSSPSDHETLSYSMIDRIDRICDDYERELRGGSQPKLEDYITRVDATGHNRLLRHLVAIDFEFRRSRGEADFAEYLKQFPDDADELKALQIELDMSPGRQFTQSGLLTGVETIVGPSESIPKLRNFKFLEVAGIGGFGTVWRAKELDLKREVAVKIPRSNRISPSGLSGVFREAEVAAKLRHQNIVKVYYVGQENGTSFIVTDYIDGVNLKDWRKNNAINPIEVARLVAKLALAIQHAHDHGVIHRDLKLANVLMDKKGEPYVADFGLAKREARDDSLAIHGQVVGTPAYMAPEQARADHEAIDRRTDVYSLGVMLYELITGVTPFHGDVPQMLQQILDVAPVAPRLIKPNIPKDLEAICLKCLAKDSSKRYDTAQALADDLNLFLNGETLRGIPAALPSRVWKWYRRNRRFVLALGTVAILVSTVSTVVVTLRHRGVKPPVPLLPVEFITEPPGCQITVVPIDPDTGDPDPAKIQNAQGVTPLTMSLEGGDYLVVAVLDSQRFHEVYRHVPMPDERIPWSGSATTSWYKRQSGVINFYRPITIPRPDVSVEMCFCEGIARLDEPPRSRDDSLAKTWKVPSFYIDRHEASLQDLTDWGTPKEITEAAGTGPFALLNYFKSVERMEAIGKRLPSAAELYYLSSTLCPAKDSVEGDDDPCVLANHSTIEGVHAGVWEWTSTKPGGAFSGSPTLPKELGFDAMARMSGCGPVTREAVVRPLVNGFKVWKERDPNAGVRGVRSVSARRSPKDFMSIVKGTPGP